MAKIVTLGEIMLRLSSKGNNRLLSAKELDVCYGGGEANVAVSLAHYNHEAYFVSRLPNNDLGESAVRELRKENVRVDFIARGGDRIGIYFLETGSSIRPSKVTYDRKSSAIAEASLEDLDLENALKGADVFHFSGITPALSKSCAEIVEKACQIAKRNGTLVSCDLNYRKKLWSKEEARKVMIPLMKYVDICIGNEEDAEACLGYKPDSDVSSGKTDASGYKDIFKKMQKDFGFKIIASTLRESFSASHNGWKALLYDGDKFYESRRYDICPIVDRVGAGDAFSAGLIHGILSYKGDLQKALEFGVAASALKHTIPGDFNQVSEEEVLNLMNGDASGRVSR